MSTQLEPDPIADAKRITTQTLREMKKDGIPVSMLTAYDYTSARIIDGAGVDVILVGDSASNVMAGHETTLPITLEHMIYHAQCVVRGVSRALVIADLPFGSYQGDSKSALVSAIRLMKAARRSGCPLPVYWRPVSRSWAIWD
jgi:3-methyl-2-oxobutanoate hydroxymethyltransferase